MPFPTWRLGAVCLAALVSLWALPAAAQTRLTDSDASRLSAAGSPDAAAQTQPVVPDVSSLSAAGSRGPAAQDQLFGPPTVWATGFGYFRTAAQLGNGDVLVSELTTRFPNPGFAGRVSQYPAGGGDGNRTDYATGFTFSFGVTQLADGTVLITEGGFNVGDGRILASSASGASEFATRLVDPTGITQLADGTVLVAEIEGGRVSAFPPGGGNANRTDFATGLSRPIEVTQLADGTVLVAEFNVGRISAYPAGGGARTDFATGLANPHSITQLADGRVLVAETGGRISAYPAAGGVRADFAVFGASVFGVTQLADGTLLVVTGSTVWSLAPVQPALAGPRTDFAQGIGGATALAPLADGRVLVAERNSNSVFAVPATGGAPTTFATGNRGTEGVTQLADGTVLVTERSIGRVSAYPSGGGPRTDFATGLAAPSGITQLADGRVLVVEVSSNRVSAFPAGGGPRTDFGTGLDIPLGITQLADGRVLVAEFSGRVSAFPPDGGDRSDFATGFSSATDVAELPDGRILVSDAGANLVYVLTPGVFQLGIVGGFSDLYGLALLPDGRALVTDPQSGRVTQFALPGGPVAITEARLFNPTAAEGDGAGYRLLGAPVAGLDVTGLAALNLVQGVAAGANPATHPAQYPSAGANLLTAFDGAGYTPPATTDEALAPGHGFFWYLYDQDVDSGSVPATFGTGTSDSFELTGAALAAFGPQAEADVMLSVADNPGANDAQMLANPFARPFAVSGISASGGTLQGGAVQVYDPAGGSFLVQMGTARLAPWQGFVAELVPATAGDPVAVTYAFASTDGGTSPVFVGRGASVRPQVRFALSGTLAGGAPVRDEAAVVRFVEGAEAGWDALDMSKITPPNAARALIAPTVPRDGAAYRLAVDTRPDGAEARVPLSLSASEAGAFSLSWAVDLPDGWTAVLTDTETGETTDLRRASETAFATTAAQDWAERFTLAVSPRGTVSSESGASAEFALAAPYPNPARGAAQIPFSLAQAGAARLTVFDLLGREVAVLVDGDRAAGAHTEALDTGRLAPGVYVVRLSAGTEMQTQRLVVVR